ncbi:alkyl hydroperoxide reductase subunit F [Staphylococcus sp. EG-SA-6]|jgi:alkyl hydroperoxide reductase subunit F|uniref:Alkyl hydroperoxide reductase subunit F n=3 Tax=Bacilli TaxID=91061 RepID=A0A2A1K608_STAHA|nr:MULTISPECIES: alkyl hydroperoxide reductase subunit F [Staphylococcus]KDP50779.1 alkyl hydroperoxide reductase, F subunit [Staphylococcus aureus subsp. aureus CO-98]MBN4936062.1 alkyl hydroperoxide reductase subunit F [Staphylococcus sp. EG-SA-6]MBY6180515.1 alkyl hydroperoxide reductase subunit F [Staphylococcaceae bacterium DP2N0-1]MDU2097000.1 alkyl hydroperoxide reductase subunit F [Staphylococcus sp.]SIJ88839.1 thioredoxin reductase [Mycobacteroides abscessus subsp. abscessus]
MLNADLKQQLQQLLGLMEGDVEFRASIGSDDKSKELKELLDEIAEMSEHITIVEKELKRTPSFSVSKPDEEAGVTFAGIPLGHEFNSLVLAILQVSGRAPKEKQSIIDQIKGLEGKYNFETYVSLTCQKCPDVVQALNLMSVVNPNITHTMIDGSVFREESEDIMAVPAVFLDGEEFGNGRMTISDILTKLGSTQDASEFEGKDPYDVLIIGGGPASGSAAIYTARKGLRTGIIADRIGGQVNDTAGIENFITVKETTGSQFSANLAAHIEEYDIDTMTGIRATNIEKTDQAIRVTLENNAVLETKTAIISTGASWRKLNIPGEDRLINKGVAFCPHCDGPLFENKDVAVIGGGNSGVEAAIDLAGIVKHVTLFEYSSELKADTVLQDRLRSLSNVDIHTNARTAEVLGEDHVTGISYEDLNSGEMKELSLDGIFVQIGLVPNTSWIGDAVELNNRGEVVIDRNNNTNVPGIFAAGDVTDQKNKQIIISMGAGANAALNAFDYIIRN